MADGNGQNSKNTPKEILLLTGVSGGGKTLALKTLEDMGFTVVDNMPLRLVPALLGDEANLPAQLALGVDVRTHDIGTHFSTALQAMGKAGMRQPHVLFLDADDDVLLRRFKETRRRHPLHDGRPVLEVVAQERQMLRPLKAEADTVLDTSTFAPADLRRYLESQFAVKDKNQAMAVFLMSFGFKHGLPKEADVVFDMRFLRNPHYDPALKPKTGKDPAIKTYIAEDENLQPTLDYLSGMLTHQLPLFAAEGKAYLTIAFGCTGGRHRSVMMAEKMADLLVDTPYTIKIHHRDVDNAAG